MSQKTIHTCDRCRSEVDNEAVRWEQKIKKITVYCPPDGINGGAFTRELCAPCRAQLYHKVCEFLKGPSSTPVWNENLGINEVRK